MISILFKLFGIAGVMLIAAGVIIQKREHEDLLYIAGGICLEVYSIYIGDLIFVILQVVFILAATYDLWHVHIETAKGSDGVKRPKSIKRYSTVRKRRK